jgi:hypothetical protein
MLLACDGGERHTSHPIDRSPELIVGDSFELAFDDDVAHRQQTADATPRRAPIV